MNGWLAGWLVGWFAGWLVGLVVRLLFSEAVGLVACLLGVGVVSLCGVWGLCFLTLVGVAEIFWPYYVRLVCVQRHGGIDCSRTC